MINKSNDILLTDKPSAPQGPLHITGVTDTSLTIAWSPPLDNGGIAIEDYCVEIKEVDKKAWKKVSVNINHVFIKRNQLRFFIT